MSWARSQPSGLNLTSAPSSIRFAEKGMQEQYKSIRDLVAAVCFREKLVLDDKMQSQKQLETVDDNGLETSWNDILNLGDLHHENLRNIWT